VASAFLQMRGLNNDLPFYICEFRANEAFEMQRMQRQLISSLANLQVPVSVGAASGAGDQSV
jgi:hypothetical protein